MDRDIQNNQEWGECYPLSRKKKTYHHRAQEVCLLLELSAPAQQAFSEINENEKVYHQQSREFFKGTSSRFSTCTLIKLLFSNCLLILLVNNPTHMYLSDFRVYFKVEVY